MSKYHAGRILFTTAVLSVLLHTYASATRMGTALNPTLMNLCSLIAKRAGISPSTLGINGSASMSGRYNQSGIPAFCIRPGMKDIEVNRMFNKSSLAKNLTNVTAIRALLNLQQDECNTSKISIKTQACYLLRTITKKVKNPHNNVSTMGNTLFVTQRGKTLGMAVVEKFGDFLLDKGHEPTPEELLLGKRRYGVTFNEFGEVLHKSGKPLSTHITSKCAECLNSLKTSITMGDTECECEDSVTLNLGGYKGSGSS